MTHCNHLDLTHLERFAVLSARRFDLNVVPRPAAMPRSGLVPAKPLAREQSARIVIHKGRIC